ncbi:MAG: transglycosylase SLT domain-containing protein [Myxococcota bacterium]
MSKERWDVVLRFLGGPMSYQGEIVARGPVVRMGADPGPGGLMLDGYRGLDSVQATITAYDGASVSITPIGTNQVRVATHANVTWSDLQTLHGPVYLSPGAVFHLGSPNRGATVEFVECRRLGVWQRGDIIAESQQAGQNVGPSVKPTRIEQLDTQGGIPKWFIPAVLALMMTTLTAMGVIVAVTFRPEPSIPGPVMEGVEYVPYLVANDIAEIKPSTLQGLEQGFDDFVMRFNVQESGLKMLDKPENWDQTFFRYTVASMKMHNRNFRFYRKLEEITDDYADVVTALREANLPTVFAAIPYWESRYNRDAKSYVCAQGYWQFMPETANRLGLEVSGCKFKGTNVLWRPTAIITPPGIIKNAEYVNSSGPSCKIERCQVDERRDLTASTRAAIEMLKQAWEHPEAKDSGSVVQMAILAHNAGFDDSAFTGKRRNNILQRYRRHLKKTGQPNAPDFYGKNITCNENEKDPHAVLTTFETCGGVLPNQTQHYGYNIVAEHLLAVCYYAANHGDNPAFNPWEVYLLGDSYCSEITVPTIDQLSK